MGQQTSEDALRRRNGRRLDIITFASLLCLGSGLLAALAASEFSNFTERTLKTLASLGFVCLALGGLAAVSNLGRPSMILGVFANPASRLFWEMIGVAGALLTSAAYLAALFREADQTITRVISLLSALLRSSQPQRSARTW